MRSHQDPNKVQQLEREVRAAFAIFRTGQFRDLVCEALAGEYFGLATYAAFADETADEGERHFWALARDVEQGMIRGLEALLDRHGIPRPDREKFFMLGEQTAAVFRGEPHDGYCEWVAPMIDKALQGFRKLEPLAKNRADAAMLKELVAHEMAFATAWSLLPDGYAAAADPLAVHLTIMGLSREIC